MRFKWPSLLFICCIGCATLAEHSPQRDLALRDLLIHDWSVKKTTATPAIEWEYREGLLPESYLNASCRQNQTMQKLTLHSLGTLFSPFRTETVAYFCPDENQYWVKHSERGKFCQEETWYGPLQFVQE